MEEELEVRPPPPTFYWYFTSEDFDEDGNLNLDLSSGRLAHKWVPNKLASAKRFLLHSDDAVGLRAVEPMYHVVKLSIADLVDVTAKYPQAIPEGYSKSGMVIKIPLKIKLTQSHLHSKEYQEGEIDSYYAVSESSLQVREFQISNLEMGLLPPEEIRQMSSVEVIQYDTIGQLTNRAKFHPIFGGMHDPHMGSLNREDPCFTCGVTANPDSAKGSCPGHFGHIELPVPIPKLLYLGKSQAGPMASKTKPILHILNSVCHHCYRIRVPEESIKQISGKVSLEFELGRRNANAYTKVRNIVVGKIVKGGMCPHCDKFNSEVDFRYTYANFLLVTPNSPPYEEDVKYFDNSKVHSIFQSISDEDCWLLGMNPETSRPENLFFTTMPVSPNTIRPLKQRGDGQWDLDDLTKLYQEVVYWSNETRRRKLGESAGYRIDDAIKNLFYAVSRVTDNRTTYIGSGGSADKLGYEGSVKKESYKGVFNRMTGKEGRFRHDLQSKQVENTGRSVISPDPNLAIDEIGVPLSVCEKVTFPEIVTKENIKELKGYIDNFHNDVFPRALGISYTNNDDITSFRRHWDSEKIERTKDSLEVGMRVKRQLIRGDIALFSRAPHLHRQSVMAFRIIPIDAKGITMNPTVCIPFNADYDGDQMNLHFLQTIEAREEARKLMLLTNNIVHARYGKLTVATDQDQTSGLYLLTHTNMRRANEWDARNGIGFTDYGIPYFTKEKVIAIYGTVYSQIRSGKEKGTNRTIETLPEPDYMGQFYTGRAVFSHLFDVLDAPYVSTTFTGNTPNTDENGDITEGKERIIIENGRLLQGTLEKDAFGEGGSSIAPSFIYHEGYTLGIEKLVEYIELVTRLGLSIHINMGYSIGIADVGASSKLFKDTIEPLYEQYARKIADIDTAFRNGKLTDYARNNDIENIMFADSDPLAYKDILINNITDEYDKKVLAPLDNEQGSSNAMQVAVRSKARGKPENTRQMGASYGMTTVAGKRIQYGMNTNFQGMGPRALPHFPLMRNGRVLPLSHPTHSGFVKNSYSKGMDPHEYWFTSTAGRRSMVESGEGEISDSGYLERKMIRALESLVVNSKTQVVNTRTQRVISFRVGDDGLSPYHIRGSAKEVNKDGYTLTLQPLKFQFRCKHGFHLEELVENGICPDCTKGSDVEYFRETFNVKKEVPVSAPTIDEMVKILERRELYKKDLTTMSKRMREFFQDSLCRPGEAIGALAGQCLGEPATQAALRTFHFAGKLTATGNVLRVKQIVESPLSPLQTQDPNPRLSGSSHASPRTIIRLKEGFGKTEAEKIRSLLTSVTGENLIRVIKYDMPANVMNIYFDEEKLSLYQIDRKLALEQLKLILNFGTKKGMFRYEIIDDMIARDGPTPVSIQSPDSGGMLLAKNLVYNGVFNGVQGVTQMVIHGPEKDEKHGRWHLEVFSVSNQMLETAMSLTRLVDGDLLETNNHKWVFNNYGLEATLHNIYTELDYQMNITDGNIGEYDMRYIRTMVDAMGELGEIQSLGPFGLGVMANPSIIAGASLERIRDPITAGSVMGNSDPIWGVTESIAIGKIPSLGDYSQ